MKKYSMMMLLVIVLVAALAGCGQNSSGNKVSTNATNDQVQTTPKVKEIEFWHYATDRKALLEDIAKNFEAETGIKVDLQLYGGDSFNSKIQSAIQGEALPNVWMFSGGKSDLSKFAENKYIADLSGQGDIFNKFNELAIKQVTFTENEVFNTKSGIYGMPLDMNNMQILYSKKLFAEAGLDPENPPATWEQFIDANKKLSAAGIAPFTSGFGSWTQFSFTEQYQFSFNTVDDLIKVRNGEKTFAEGNFEQVFALIEDMSKNKSFMNGTATIDLPTAEAAFANNQVAMLYDGSWAINVLKGLNPDFKSEDYGVMLPPTPASSIDTPKIAGGVGAWFVASATQTEEELAASIQFMDYMTNKENQIRYANESSNIPANKEAIDPSSLDPLLADFYNGMDNVQPSIVGYTPGEIADAYGKLVQSVVIGTKTAAEAVKELDETRKGLMK